MLGALASIPPDDISATFKSLQDFVPEELEPVVNYFEDYNIGGPNRGGRKNSTFAIKWWYVYERIRQADSRANNYSEAAHRCFQTKLGVGHPSMWRFMNCLKNVQKGRDIFMDGINRGEEPRTKKRRLFDVDNKLQVMIARYDNMKVLDYLKGRSL